MLWDIFSISNLLPSFCYTQRFSLRLSNIAWCYAPRSSPRYGRHKRHMVCHMVLTIRGRREARWNPTYPTSKLGKKAPFQQNRFFHPESNPSVMFSSNLNISCITSFLTADIPRTAVDWILKMYLSSILQLAALTSAKHDAHDTFQF